jgi:dipeptidyl aminopeptidase/acylaminoacyl peptidase
VTLFARLKVAAAALCMALLTGCASAPSHPSLRAAASAQMVLPPLVPVRQFVADWDAVGAFQISPDGKQLLWLARKGLGPGLFIKNLQTGVVRSFALNVGGVWAEDSRHVLMHVHNGDENVQLFELDTQADGTQLKNLTPFVGANSFVHSRIQDSLDVLISSNKRDRKVFDLYRYDHASGRLNLLAENPGSVALWITNAKGQVVGRARKVDGLWLCELPVDATLTQWRAAFKAENTDFESVRPLGVSADNEWLWALSNRGRDKMALVKLDLNSGAETLVHADARVDVSNVLMSPAMHTPLAVGADPDHQEWKVLDARFQPVFDKLKGTTPARVTVTSISRDENFIVASVSRETGGQYVLYDVAQNQITVLGELTSSRIHKLGASAVRRPVSYTSRDGLTLNGYVTMPTLGVAAVQGSAVNLPTVVYVHGGPWARDLEFDGDPMPAFLANRGYAVLQVNYRGSRGYGRAFMEAAQGEFAGKMHTDLLDGIDHLVALGISDPRKVAIMGMSYGGYASMVGMSFSPERFACGISVVGMSDLASLLENAPPYWELGKPTWIKYVGDPAKPEDRALMTAKSPLYRAGEVRGPMLLAHGARDVRVKLDQSQRMADALTKAGKTVDLVVYPKAGHGLHRWPDNLSFYRKTEDFLAQCLGGRSAGFDYFELASWAL